MNKPKVLNIGTVRTILGLGYPMKLLAGLLATKGCNIEISIGF